MTESLFKLDVPSLDAVPKGLPLIVLLRSMTDVCHLIESIDMQLWESHDRQRIATFNTDLLLDYRARRPEMLFKRNRLTSYEPDELTLHLHTDNLGKPYLVLSGFEPDYRWERFIDCVLLLIADLQVSTTVWLHALPMPVPHTRPISMTLSGTLEEFIAENSDWQPTTQLSASISHVLEYRLTELGSDVLGCVLLVPHYLSGNYYPGATLAGISVISRVTGLLFDTEDLLQRDTDFHTQLAEQIGDNPEHLEMIAALEKRYDRFREQQRGITDGLFSDLGDEPIPSADELAHEFENFLANSDSDPKFSRDKNLGMEQQSQDVQPEDGSDIP